MRPGYKKTTAMLGGEVRDGRLEKRGMGRVHASSADSSVNWCAGELSAVGGGEQTLYQHSINFPPGDTKIGWCVFESKPGSKWTAELLKKKQDTEKKDWATQDVYEIMKPAGIDAHYK